MKEVLLLGDSIRHAYQSRVMAGLGDGYCVHAPTDNCRFSGYTLNSLRYWLPEFPRPDIIHWNNGLWDTAILYQEDGCFTPLETYLENMSRILRELKKTGAHIIFATTTPCRPEKESITTAAPPCHRNSDIRQYNDAICPILQKAGVLINNLYQIIEADIPAFICDDLIHPTEKGKEVLSEAVIKKIREVSEKDV